MSTLWLDWKLFGNGRGMKSPFWDDTFFWLVNTAQEERDPRNGRLYRWVGGFGAQLVSYEWRMPAPGTRRRLLNLQFEVFGAQRRWFRVYCSWQLVGGCKNVEDIRALRKLLLERA